VNEVLPLEEVCDTSVFGSKAVGLGRALRDGLPVPPGFALSGPLVEAVAAADEAAVERVEFHGRRGRGRRRAPTEPRSS